jgi:hypothetical protein
VCAAVWETSGHRELPCLMVYPTYGKCKSPIMENIKRSNYLTYRQFKPNAPTSADACAVNWPAGIA